MATDSSILAWRIPWTEEPDGLQSIGSQRVRHNWATKVVGIVPATSFHLNFIYLYDMSYLENHQRKVITSLVGHLIYLTTHFKMGRLVLLYMVILE